MTGENIHFNLKKLKRKGISLTDIAERTGVSYMTLYYQNKKKKYTTDVLDKISEAFNIDVSELVKGPDKNPFLDKVDRILKEFPIFVKNIINNNNSQN